LVICFAGTRKKCEKAGKNIDRFSDGSAEDKNVLLFISRINYRGSLSYSVLIKSLSTNLFLW